MKEIHQIILQIIINKNVTNPQNQRSNINENVKQEDAGYVYIFNVMDGMELEGKDNVDPIYYNKVQYHYNEAIKSFDDINLENLAQYITNSDPDKYKNYQILDKFFQPVKNIEFNPNELNNYRNNSYFYFYPRNENSEESQQFLMVTGDFEKVIVNDPMVIKNNDLTEKEYAFWKPTDFSEDK